MLVQAEIEFLGSWEPITIEEALKVSRRRIIRCPKCHQRLSVHKARADGRSRAHFEHWPNSGGCVEAGAGGARDEPRATGGQA